MGLFPISITLDAKKDPGRAGDFESESSSCQGSAERLALTPVQI